MKSGFGNDLYLDDINLVQNADAISESMIESVVSGAQVVPNPASTAAKIVYHSSRNENLQIELLDLTGRVLFSRMESSKKGLNESALELDGLSSGLYFYRIRNSSKILYSGKLNLQD